MTARTRHRRGRRASAGQRWALVLAGIVILALITVLLAPVLVLHWVRHHVRDDAFRARMERSLGTGLNASVELSPLRWSGDAVSAAETRIRFADGWEAEIGALHVGLDWNAFRRRTWRVIGAGADDLIIRRSAAPLAKEAAVLEQPAADETNAAVVDSTPAWLRRWLPDRTEVDGLRVDRFAVLHPGFGTGAWSLRGGELRIAPWQQESSLQFHLTRGSLEMPVTLPGRPGPVKLDLAHASGRISANQLVVTEAILHWLEPAEIVVRGQFGFDTTRYELSTHLTGVPITELLTEDWRLRVSGKLGGDLTLSGSSRDEPVTTGDLQLRDGVLTALPLLDQLAAYTGVERFKRLVLDIATAHVRSVGETLRFEKMVLQSSGLLRMEGSLTIRQRQIEGVFMLGVTPETLRWIPGAQQHVFTLTNPAGPPGMVWTNLTLSGTLDVPREDLTARLLTGAGKALLAAPGAIIGEGSNRLLTPLLDAADQAGGGNPVIKGATEAVGSGVETGVKMLQDIGGGLLGK